MVTVAQSLREQVAWACRIIAAEGYADLTLGHVSGRGADGEIWIKRKGVALDEVETGDVVALEDTDAVLHLETVLHTGVYRAREDVGAVVHGHPPYATALGATAADLALLAQSWQMGCNPTASSPSLATALAMLGFSGDVVPEPSGAMVVIAIAGIMLSRHRPRLV